MSFLLPASQEALRAVSNIWDSTAAQNPVSLQQDHPCKNWTQTAKLYKATLATHVIKRRKSIEHKIPNALHLQPRTAPRYCDLYIILAHKDGGQTYIKGSQLLFG